MPKNERVKCRVCFSRTFNVALRKDYKNSSHVIFVILNSKLRRTLTSYQKWLRSEIVCRTFDEILAVISKKISENKVISHLKQWRDVCEVEVGTIR